MNVAHKTRGQQALVSGFGGEHFQCGEFPNFASGPCSCFSKHLVRASDGTPGVGFRDLQLCKVGVVHDVGVVVAVAVVVAVITAVVDKVDVRFRVDVDPDFFLVGAEQQSHPKSKRTKQETTQARHPWMRTKVSSS